MFVHPRDLADRMSDRQQSEIFRLPIDAARCKAREIIKQAPQAGYIVIVKTGGRFPTVRSSSRCEICGLRIE